LKKIGTSTISGIGWNEGSKYSSRYKGKRKDLKGLEYFKLPIEVEKVFSIGKNIIMRCINSEKRMIFIQFHLGMTATFHFGKEFKQKHSNLWIKFCDPNFIETSRFYFTDTRKFGSCSIYTNLNEILKKNGPCLMTAALLKYGEKVEVEGYEATRKLWREALNKSKSDRPIAEFMMHQKYVSGIGNYLRAEILYRAKIDPKRTIIDLNMAEKDLLYDCSLDVMYESWKTKGPSAGYIPGGHFYLHVYGRKRDDFGNLVVKYLDANNRTVHYVPAIQL
jgi:formamidopyrimidine-DNA glycosylase